jgi:DNA-binding response OmpR family regulator
LECPAKWTYFGAFDYITKPLSIQMLLVKIRHVLEKPWEDMEKIKMISFYTKLFTGSLML